MITHCAHSADVTIGLLINGIWLPVAQLGPDFLLLDVAIARRKMIDWTHERNRREQRVSQQFQKYQPIL
jgi:hypothetical protein